MKKALFLALSLAFLLTACGETTLPDTSEPNPVDNTQEMSLPESCLLYYDLGDAVVLAEDKSLPLAQNAGDGYATSYSVWYDGEYQDLALQDGDSGISVADMTGGSAVRLRRGARRLERRALPLRAPDRAGQLYSQHLPQHPRRYPAA